MDSHLEGLPHTETHEPESAESWQIASMDEYRREHARSLREPDVFWGEAARRVLLWQRDFTHVREGDFGAGDIRWFCGGRLNVCENAVDRWARTYPDRRAIIWEGDDPNFVRTLTYRDLLHEVCRMANLLLELGVRSHDRVTIYLPTVPEAAIAMLACARIGAVHSVVFAGFSAANLRDRIVDAQSAVLITMDCGFRGGKRIALRQIVAEAIAFPDCALLVTHVLLLAHRQGGAPHQAQTQTLGPDQGETGRAVWVSGEERLRQMRPYCPPAELDAEHPLFVLYTSGSTGKPKGIMHTTAGYALYTSMTHRLAFDYRAEDVFGCVAEHSWITGHSYVVYGPLLNGATTLMFESIPTYPDAGRYWALVEKHRLTHFYAAPTAIRTLMRFGPEFVTKYDRSSLRVLGSVGEPINPEAWRWYFGVVGERRCPIIDTYWQTETGGFLVCPLPCFKLKPGSASLPFFGVDPLLMDASTGEEVETKGSLCIRQPWPGMMRSIHNDHERMTQVYFSTFKDKQSGLPVYFTGDGAVKDKDGYLWITGRVDDVIKVSGHRIGSAEVEHALVQHPAVAEAAVIGFPHAIKGEGLFCFVTIKNNVAESDTLKHELTLTVRKMIGPVATPDVILFAHSLPKTRSGKIMRRILRTIVTEPALSVAAKLGDVSTLADPSVLPELVANVAHALAPCHRN